MEAESDAVMVLRESARSLQRIAGDLTDGELVERIRHLALECDHDAAALEQLISDTKLKPANDPI